jgi:hypothetical protein
MFFFVKCESTIRENTDFLGVVKRAVNEDLHTQILSFLLDEVSDLMKGPQRASNRADLDALAGQNPAELSERARSSNRSPRESNFLPSAAEDQR